MAVGRMNGVAGLTGFSFEKMYVRFAGSKKKYNEVTVRRNSNVMVMINK